MIFPLLPIEILPGVEIWLKSTPTGHRMPLRICIRTMLLKIWIGLKWRDSFPCLITSDASFPQIGINQLLDINTCFFQDFFRNFSKFHFNLFIYIDSVWRKIEKATSRHEIRMNFSDLIEKLDSYPFYSVKYQVWRPNYYKFPQVSLFQRFDFKTFTRLHIYLNETPSLKPHNSIYWACRSQSQQQPVVVRLAAIL